MQYLWTGRWPANRAPRVEDLRIDGQAAADNVYLKPGSTHKAALKVEDPESDPLTFRWEVMLEVAPGGYAGMGEVRSKPMTELIQKAAGPEVTFAAPEKRAPTVFSCLCSTARATAPPRIFRFSLDRSRGKPGRRKRLPHCLPNCLT